MRRRPACATASNNWKRASRPEMAMKCDFCTETATVHITDMSGGKFRELHLCEACSEKEKHGSLKSQVSVEHFVKGIISAFAGELVDEPADLTCPYCGTKYAEFRTKGRLGCPADYDIFRKGLWPMLERIHGCVEHRGKSPVCGALAVGPKAELIRLRRSLRDAVAHEDYELAAHLRDQIRAQEAAHEPR
jgi:protein arginine kinase activator